MSVQVYRSPFQLKNSTPYKVVLKWPRDVAYSSQMTSCRLTQGLEANFGVKIY